MSPTPAPPPPQERPRELPGLTPLRGIAVTMVVFFHLEAFVPVLRIPHYTLVFANGLLWVDFFFILSGYVMYHVYGRVFSRRFDVAGLRDFLALRLARIYPVHVVVLLAMVLAEVLYAGFVGDGSARLPRRMLLDPPFSGRTSLASIATNLLLVQSWGIHERATWNVPSWAISVQWALYLIFPFLMRVVAHVRGMARAAAAVAIFAGYALLVAWQKNLDLTYDFGVIRGVLGFGLGLLVYGADRDGALPAWLGADGSAALLLAWILAVTHVGANPVLVMPAFALLIVVTTRSRGAWLGVLRTRPLAWLGRVSYSLFMVHAAFLLLAVRAWNLFASRPIVAFSPGQAVVALLVSLAAILVLSQLCWRFIEVPCRRGLRRHLSRPEPRPA